MVTKTHRLEALLSCAALLACLAACDSSGQSSKPVETGVVTLQAVTQTEPSEAVTTAAETTEATTLTTVTRSEVTTETIAQTAPETAPPAAAVTEPESPQLVTPDGAFSTKDLAVVYQNKTLTIFMNPSAIQKAIGAANEVSTSPSCLYEGEDKVYTYAGMTLYSYASATKEQLVEIDLLDNTCSTAKGVRVGDSKATLEAAYGTGYNTEGNLLTYKASDTSYLECTLENGIITMLSLVIQA